MRIFSQSLVAMAGLALAGVVAADKAAGDCSGKHARTKPPTGAIVVDASRAYQGSFATIKEAAATLKDQAETQTMFFMPGTYKEQVLFAPMKGPLVLQGYTCDTTRYDANQVTITAGVAQKDIPPEVTGETRNDMTSTVRFKSPNTRVYNLNIANTAGNVGQALAINVNATDQAFYACQLTGYQDTVLSDKGRQLFARSLIVGAIDVVFGRYATTWLECCDLQAVGKGFLTASGREKADSPAIYVFNRTRITSTQGPGITYLGRPWRPFAQVVFQNSEISDAVNPLGWARWDETTSTDDVVFQEFNNVGAGADTAHRAVFSSRRKNAVKIEEVLGDGYKNEPWIDMAYL